MSGTNPSLDHFAKFTDVALVCFAESDWAALRSRALTRSSIFARIPFIESSGDCSVYQLLGNINTSVLLKKQLSVFVLAFLIAEFFYKFHSFALECLAFLVTWFVFDAIAQMFVWSKADAGG
jgi:hypothetical protein